MGEGGVDRDIFFDKMEWWEIRSFLAGLRRRERSGWNIMRAHAWIIMSALGGNAASPEAMMPFWWECHAPQEEEEDDVEDLAKLQAWAEEWNRTQEKQQNGSEKNLLQNRF